MKNLFSDLDLMNNFLFYQRILKLDFGSTCRFFWC